MGVVATRGAVNRPRPTPAAPVVQARDFGPESLTSDATFCPTTGKSGAGTSFASYNYPTKFLRHYGFNVSMASNGGSNTWDGSTSWADDVSRVVSSPWAP